MTIGEMRREKKASGALVCRSKDEKGQVKKKTIAYMISADEAVEKIGNSI